jgi:hypothetical protein
MSEDDLPEAVEVTDELLNERLAHLGGEIAEIDEEDLSGLDRGDDPNAEPAKAKDDDDVALDESEKEPTGEKDEADEDDGEGDAKGDADETELDAESGEDDSTDESDSDDTVSDDDKEDDSEDSESAEDDVEPEGDDETGDKGIPRHRFNEVNERMKAAERRLSDIENQDKAADEAEEEVYDFDEAEGKYIEMVLDGKTDDAKALRREIRAAEKADFQLENSETTSSSIAENDRQRELSSLAVQAEEMFPVFSKKHDDFDPVMAGKVMTFYRGYELDGMSSADAFVASLADVIELYDLEERYNDVEADDKGDEKPEKKKVKVSKIKDKIEAEKQSHQAVAGEGKGSKEVGAVAPDINDMSDEEMDALPEGTLERMRGDTM